MIQAYLKRNIENSMAVRSDKRTAHSLASNRRLPNCSKMVSVPKPMIKKQKLNGAENMARVQIHLWKAR